MLPNATHVLTIDQTDSLLVEFDTGDIIHLRPSGNAPELRCYAKSNDQNQAIKISTGCLNRIERSLKNNPVNASS